MHTPTLIMSSRVCARASRAVSHASDTKTASGRNWIGFTPFPSEKGEREEGSRIHKVTET